MDITAFLLRATVVLLGASVLSWALRKGAAGTRHILWTASFVALLGLPLILLTGMAWEVPVLPSGAGVEAASVGAELAPTANPPHTSGAVTRARVEPALAPAPAASAIGGGLWWATILRTAWIIGTGAALLSLLIGALRLKGRVQDARPLEDPDWLESTRELKRELGIRRDVRLFTSVDTTTPMTSGWRHPIILLPLTATDWSAERRHVVLAHELVHVRRSDAMRQVLARITLGLYWFHPLSWLASRLARSSREQACDETVLSLGTRPSDYATHLLDLAEGLRPAPAVLALPIVQRSMLEKRIMAILRPHPTRATRLTSASVILAVTALGISAATARPVPAHADGAVVATLAVAPVVPASSASRPALAPVVGAISPREPLRADGALAQDITCRMEGASGNFRGSISTSGNRTQQSGWHNGDRSIQRYVDDLRLCMRVHGDVVMADDGLAVRAVGRDSWLVLESEEDELQRLVITEGAGGIEHAWTVGGRSAPFDADARAWRDQMLEVLGGYWESSRIRGEQSSLRGKISSHRGHISSLRGQISSHRGHVSSLRGQMSSQQGHVSSLKGRISSHRGNVSSLKGQISSHRGAMSSLNAARRATSDNDTRARLARELQDHEDEIRDIEQQIVDYELDAKIAEVEREIDQYGLEGKQGEVRAQLDDYDLDAKIAEVERDIEAYDLDGKVRDLEREIVELDADRRAEALERALEPKVEALRRMIRGL